MALNLSFPCRIITSTERTGTPRITAISTTEIERTQCIIKIIRSSSGNEARASDKVWDGWLIRQVYSVCCSRRRKAMSEIRTPKYSPGAISKKRTRGATISSDQLKRVVCKSICTNSNLPVPLIIAPVCTTSQMWGGCQLVMLIWSMIPIFPTPVKAAIEVPTPSRI